MTRRSLPRERAEIFSGRNLSFQTYLADLELGDAGVYHQLISRVAGAGCTTARD